jgi:hypothetical protein
MDVLIRKTPLTRETLHRAANLDRASPISSPFIQPKTQPHIALGEISGLAQAIRYALRN